MVHDDDDDDAILLNVAASGVFASSRDPIKPPTMVLAFCSVFPGQTDLTLLQRRLLKCLLKHCVPVRDEALFAG